MVDEARIEAIERRLARLERLLRVEEPSAPVPAPPAAQMHPPAAPPVPPPAPSREPVRAPDVNLEELFGGRVLAWLGGSAVVLGAVFFLVMAVSRGWIDEPTRVTLAFVASSALLGVAASSRGAWSRSIRSTSSSRLSSASSWASTDSSVIATLL